MSITIDPTKVRAVGPGIDLKGEMAEASQLGRMVYITGEGDAPDKAEWSETDGQEAVSVRGVVGMIVAGHVHRTTGVVSVAETVTIRVWGQVWIGDADLTLTDALYLEDENTSVDGLLDTSPGTVTRLVARPVADEVIFIDGASAVEPTSS